MKKVIVQIPATSANLGPGFDVLGVALGLFNEVHACAEGRSANRRIGALDVTIRGAGTDELPRDASNLLVRAMECICRKARCWPQRLSLELVNRIPLSRGMGSSSAAIVGGLAAANHLLGDRFSQQEVLAMAVEMEGHPDNVTPALLGGFCISGMFQGKPRYWTIPAAADLKAVMAVPEQPLATKAARAVLPQRVALQDAVFTASRVAFLIGALQKKRYDWLGDAMEDVLHQPYRKRLIPGLMDVIAAARKAGAYGAALSGAGSCVIALTPSGALEKKVGLAMQAVFKRHRMASQILHLNLENKGIRFK